MSTLRLRPLLTAAATLFVAVGSAYSAPINYLQWLRNGEPVVDQVPHGNDGVATTQGMENADFYRFRIDSAVPPGMPVFFPTSISYQMIPLNGASWINGGVTLIIQVYAGLYSETEDLLTAPRLLSTSDWYPDLFTLTWVGYSLPNGDYTVAINAAGTNPPVTDNTGYRLSMSGIGVAPTAVPEPHIVSLILPALLGVARRRRRRTMSPEV